MNSDWRPGSEAGTILGIEVLLPNSMGRIWLEGAGGLHLLYGRNGAGKSMLLNALRDFFKGQQSQARVRCFMRLPDEVLGGPIGPTDISRDADDLITTVIQSNEFSLHSDAPISVARDLLKIQLEIDEGIDADEFALNDFSDSEYRYLREHPLTDEMRASFQKMVYRLHCENLWRHVLVDQWATSCLQQARAVELGQSLDHCLKVVDVERTEEWIEMFASREAGWSHNLLTNGWEEFVRLALLSVFSEDALYSLPYADDLLAGQGDGGVVAPAIQEVAASRLLCIEAKIGRWVVSPAAKLSDDTPNLNQLWTETQEALRSELLRHNPHAAKSDRELAATYRLIRSTVNVDQIFELLVPSGLFGRRQNTFDYLMTEDGPPDHPYVAIQTAGYTVSLERRLPGWPVVVDCDDPLDPDSWITTRFTALFGSEPQNPPLPDPFLAEVIGHLVDDEEDRPDETAVGNELKNRWLMGSVKSDSTSDSSDTSLLWLGPSASSLETVAEFPEFDALRGKVAEYGKLLPKLSIGLGELRVESNPRLPAWIDGRPARLEALDLPTGNWVQIGDLSDAQRRWVAIAIQIGEAREEAAQSFIDRENFDRSPFYSRYHRDRYILDDGRAGSIALFGDEIDTGVHIAASKAIFKTLSEIPGIGFVSSHSPTALRTPLVRLVNVHRNSGGRVAIASPGLGGDVEEAAIRLGIDPTDVLASMYLVIFVEGSHDRIVIEELLRGEENTDRIFLIEGRGTHTMKAVADARLLVDYCDLRILIVLDNVRNDRFKPVLESLQALCDQNVAVGRAIRESGLEHLRSESTPEERVLIEILERGARRGILDRIDIHGLPALDISELFPPSSFGLEKDWSDYRKEHWSDYRKDLKSAGRGRNFKTWINDEYGASISQRSIEDAVTGLDHMPDSLVALHEAILVAAAIASRDRGLSVTTEVPGPLP
jgi:hypothetical protein